MKIKKFNESVEYTPEMKEQIEKFGWNTKRVVKYYVTSPSIKSPSDASGFYENLEYAVKDFHNLNSEWKNQEYCIFKSETYVMSEEEINLELKANKYNL